MGILTDYFRAADEQDALRANDFPGGPLQGADPFDGIEAKGIEPLVVLAKLVALIRGTEWSPALVDARQVSPEDPEAGSGILELDTRLRDDLAALPADRMDSLA